LLDSKAQTFALISNVSEQINDHVRPYGSMRHKMRMNGNMQT